MNIVTQDEIEEWIDLADDEQKNLLSIINTRTSATIARYCGWAGWGPPEDRTERHPGGCSIQPRYFPIVSVTSVHHSTTGTFDNTTLVDSDLYGFDERRIWKYRGSWSGGYGVLQIVYRAGFASTMSIPEDLKQACLDQIKWEFESRHRGGKGEELPYASALLSSVRFRLRPYKRAIGIFG